MTTIKRFTASLLLISCLSMAAFANDGVMGADRIPPPPPPPVAAPQGGVMGADLAQDGESSLLADLLAWLGY